MVKDSKRFADSGGWGWGAFGYDAASDTFKPATVADNPAAGKRREVRVRVPHVCRTATTFSRSTERGEYRIAGAATIPVRLGFVTSLAKPGGNATGVTIFSGGLAAKRLGLLRDLVPQAKIVAVMINSDWPAAVRFQTDVEEAAHVVGLSIQILRANNESEIDDAFNGLAQTQAGALLVGPGPFFDSRRDKLIALAAKSRARESRATATLQRPAMVS